MSVTAQRYKKIQAAYAKEIDPKTGKPIQLSLTDARRELVAKYVQQKLFTDEAAIDRLVRSQSGLAGRVLNSIQFALSKMGAGAEAKKLLEAERLYCKAFATAKISPSIDARSQHSVVSDSEYDYRVIVDGGISYNMNPEEAFEIAKAAVTKLRGKAFVSLVDGEEISVAQKNKTSQKLYRPGLPVNDTKYVNRLAVASQIGEAIVASSPMPETDAGAVNETHSSFKATSRANRSVIVEIPEFDASGKLVGAKTYRAQLVVLGNDGGKIAYDVARINEITDAHSDLLRLKNQGLDIDRASIERIVSENLDVVNSENNRQHSVSTISFNDLFGGSAIGNTMQDAQYAAAVKKGDMEAAQKFVDDQANRSLSKSKAPRDASGRLEKFFTGTDNGPYTVPDPLLADDGISLFGTTERQTAGTYTHNPSGNPIYDKQGVFSQYFDMRNPLVINNERGSSWHDMTQGKENYVDVRIHAYNDGAYLSIVPANFSRIEHIGFSNSSHSLME